MSVATSRAEPQQGSPTWLPVWFGLAGLAVFSLVAVFKPAGQFFYPRCLLYTMTGLQCPGCGLTRALHAGLRGDFATAWKMNALGILIAPLLGWSYAAWLVSDLGQRRWFQPLANRYILSIFVAVVLAFGVTRNFPWVLHWGTMNP